MSSLVSETTDKTILVLNGPNLNLLGTREPEIYGPKTLGELIELSRASATRFGFLLESYQSNSESDLIDMIHGGRDRCQAMVVNAGALTHYSWSLMDALRSFKGVIVELHLTNTFAREAWRHDSVISPVANGVIVGFGPMGYSLAVEAACRLVLAHEEDKS